MGESNVIQVPFSLQMVTYQCAEFLPEAVESALSQTFKNFELIIVNDGSTDNSQHFLSNIKDPRVKVFETPHLGLIAARNLALKKSMGLWTAIWDADDISLPNRLQLCWETIHDFDKKKDEKKLAAISGQMIEMTQRKKILNSAPQFPIDKNKIVENLGKSFSICHGASIFKTELARKLGGYRKVGGLTGEDEDLFIRLQREGRLVNLSDFLIYRRIHPRSLCTEAGFRVRYGIKDSPSKNRLRNLAVYFFRIARARVKHYQNYW